MIMQEFPASCEPHLFYAKFSSPHLCQETAGKVSQLGGERKQKRKFKEVCTLTALRFSAASPIPLQNESNRSCKIHSDWDERSPKERRPHIIWCLSITGGAPQVALVVKNPSANAGDIRDGVPSLSRQDPLEEGTATHSSILAWRIPWTEEPGELQPTGLQRVRHDWSNLASTHLPTAPRMISPPKPCYS